MQLFPSHLFANVRRSSIDVDVRFCVARASCPSNVCLSSIHHGYLFFFFSRSRKRRFRSFFPRDLLALPRAFLSPTPPPLLFGSPGPRVRAMATLVLHVVRCPWTCARYTTCVVVDAGDIVVSLSPGCRVPLYPTDATPPGSTTQTDTPRPNSKGTDPFGNRKTTPRFEREAGRGEPRGGGARMGLHHHPIRVRGERERGVPWTGSPNPSERHRGTDDPGRGGCRPKGDARNPG